MNITKPRLIFILAILSALTSFAGDKENWEELAKRGDTVAMISLGVMYHTADGVPVDYQKAFDWYLKAYKKNDGDALNNIGVLFRDGLGVQKNEKVAYLLFLAVHMEGLGTQATQHRAGRNLGRLSQTLQKEELYEALSYTWNYVDQIVTSRGQNLNVEKDVLPSPERPRIRDNNWWLDSERKKMDFASPAPWNTQPANKPGDDNSE